MTHEEHEISMNKIEKKKNSWIIFHGFKLLQVFQQKSYQIGDCLSIYFL